MSRMNSTYVLFILLMFMDVFSEARITSLPAVNVTFEAKKPVNLTCSVPNMDNITVIWRKKGLTVPISVGDLQLMYSERFQVFREENVSILNLKYPGVHESGIYICSFTTNRLDLFTTEFTLRREGKSYTDIDTGKVRVKAFDGDTVSLPCIVQRRHKKKVIWLDPSGNVVTIGTKSLRLRFKVNANRQTRHWPLNIKNVRRVDFGAYTCLVSTDPALSSMVILEKKEKILQAAIPQNLPETTASSLNYENTTTEEVNDDSDIIYNAVPNLGAVHKKGVYSDSTREHMILGASLSGLFICIILFGGIYLFHRIQKTTRRIIQQEISLEHTRLRRRDRRLNSESRVLIRRPSEDIKKRGRERETENQLCEPGNCNAKQSNPYCEPWSSSSNIIEAMGVAYSRKSSTGTIPRSQAATGLTLPNNVTFKVDSAGKLESEKGTSSRGEGEGACGGSESCLIE